MTKWSIIVLCALGLVGSGSASLDVDEPTWIRINQDVYGAKPDKRGPIGGGSGYAAVVTKGDHVVEDLDGLLEALGKATKGQTIFIPDETEIDLTARIYIEELVLVVPEGVTLAGNRGHAGSKGALLTSDSLKTPVMIRPAGPDVRITGLRLRGPNGKRYLEHHRRAFRQGKGRDYFYLFPTSYCITTEHHRLEVDNCDISAFSHAGIYLTEGDGHSIHHNFIHDCQYHGLGYGISHGRSTSVIEHNLFDANRHSIAATGVPGSGYIARHNVELGVSFSHCFDVHGGRDREDGTDIAGTAFEISNNTFRAPQMAVKIRGVPEKHCLVHHNWFPTHESGGRAVGASSNTKTEDNAYGPRPRAAK